MCSGNLSEFVYRLFLKISPQSLEQIQLFRWLRRNRYEVICISLWMGLRIKWVVGFGIFRLKWHHPLAYIVKYRYCCIVLYLLYCIVLHCNIVHIHYSLNSYSASHDNWCTATLWNRTMTAQCEGMGEVGSARYEPALLPPCPSIRVLNSNCQEIHSLQQTGLAV